MITVLLIDDNEDEFLFLSEALYRMDKCINCVHADSAEAGLEILGKFSPHYIYLDIDLPMTTGMECIGMIRSLEGQEKTPIVVYSAAISTKQWERAKSLGATGYLKKSTSSATLSKDLLAFFLRFNKALFSS